MIFSLRLKKKSLSLGNHHGILSKLIIFAKIVKQHLTKRDQKQVF